MGVKQKLSLPFPPRLKGFLEDPGQLMCGVGTNDDSACLQRDYGVCCRGLMELSKMAAERKIPLKSLAALDEVYGRPGREVFKTKKILSWNWDKEVLQERWVWYAAKDAFAGVAIYENLISGTSKSVQNEDISTVQGHHTQLAKEEEERTERVFRALISAYGTRKQYPWQNMLTTVVNKCVWFRKLYSAKERDLKARWYLQKLIREAKVVPVETLSNHTANGKFVLEERSEVKLNGKHLSNFLRTPEGLELVKPFFNNRTLDLSTLSREHCTITDRPEEQGDEDLRDLRMFLDFSHIWDEACRLPGLIQKYMLAYQKKQQKITSMTATKRYSAGTPRVTALSPTNGERGIVLEEDALQTDMDMAIKICTRFMKQLLKRKLCVLQDDRYVFGPTFKSRLVLASRRTEAPWILPPKTTTLSSTSACTPSLILSNERQGSGAAKRPHEDTNPRRRVKKRRAGH